MAETIDSVFDNATVIAEDSKEAEKKAAAKERNQEMKSAFLDRVQNDPTYQERNKIWSNYVSVVNTLGSYKGSGNIKLGEGSTKEHRVLEPTSATVGYVLSYTGDTPIQYRTEEYTFNPETQKYEGTTVTKTAEPNSKIILNRKNAALFCSINEISFTVANGIFHPSSKKLGTNATWDDTLNSFHFRFSDSQKSVNDDDVKIIIEDADGNIKDEYVSTFGYLLNPKDKKVRGTTKKDGTKYTAQDICAAYIQKVLHDQGVL
jgi:hypothetical protein